MSHQAHPKKPIETASVVSPAHGDLVRFADNVRLSMLEAKKTDRPCWFENKGKEYARIVLNTMIDNAESSVFIFAHRLHSEVHDAGTIKAFLKRHPEGEVRIVVEEANPMQDPESALRDLSEEVAKKKIALSIVNHRDVPDHLDRDNICVVDGIHVRLETDQRSRKAAIFFADPQVGKKERDRFEKIEGLAKPYA